MASSLFQALHISRQDMIDRLLDLDVVSNNLANTNTTGYKASRGNFQELLTQQTLHGSRLQTTQTLTAQGALSATQRSLDWAISGEGYLQVRLADGSTGYTRDGQLTLDASGALVNSGGLPLIWEGALPEGTTRIDLLPGGGVQATTITGEIVLAGRVRLARFANPSGLAEAGENVYRVSPNSGEAQLGAPGEPQFGALVSGALEQSNVSLSQEMTHMMTLQRAFQMAVRSFQQTDSMIAQAIHLRKG